MADIELSCQMTPIGQLRENSTAQHVCSRPVRQVALCGQHQLRSYGAPQLGGYHTLLECAGVKLVLLYWATVSPHFHLIAALTTR